MNKGDVEGGATAKDPSFGERMRVTRGTVGEAIVNHQSSIINQRFNALEFWSHDVVTVHPLTAVFSRICPAEYGYGPYNSGRKIYLLGR